ncbi:MAG TPA: phosphate acyltransferase, partial [Aminobacteriaceae bacterium]|nr:phosphate acyltransferase [Aminobacteriaceae bacterium]
MEQIRSLSQLLDYAKKIGAEKGPKKLSVAMAEEAGLLTAIEEARKAGFAEAILVGNGDKMKAAAEQAGVDLANYEVIDERDEPSMGISAVSQVSSKKADIYMKGQIHTNNFLRAMLSKEVGLRKGKNTISHCYFHSVEGYDRIFFIADAAFNMYPDL